MTKRVVDVLTEAHKFFLNGYLSLIEPIEQMKGWRMVLEADEPDANKVKGIFCFKNVVFI